MYGEVNTVVSSWEACLNQGRDADINEKNEVEQRDEAKKKHPSMPLTPMAHTQFIYLRRLDLVTQSSKRR